MTSILVVDDNTIDQRLVSGLLTCVEGWKTQTASNGVQALEILEQCPADIIVTDLQMPEMNGLELVAAVKELNPMLPVILITGQGSDEIALEALQAGAVSYSPKGSLSRDLVRTIQKVLSLTSKIRAAPVVRLAPISPNDQFSVQFELGNDSDLIWPLIEQLQNNLPPWSSSDHLQIGVALDEALTNAIYHGNLEVSSDLKHEDETAFFQEIDRRREIDPYCNRKVRIAANFAPDEIRLSIADEGPGFRPDSVDDPLKEINLQKISGRGLLLIRSFMDDVWHNASGNEIVMLKRRHRED